MDPCDGFGWVEVGGAQCGVVEGFSRLGLGFFFFLGLWAWFRPIGKPGSRPWQRCRTSGFGLVWLRLRRGEE